jgi:zinc transport system substrate-binding protein
MKKKLLLLGGLMAFVLIIAMAFSFIAGTKKEENEKLTIVTSFYPIYILTENIVGNMDNIDVINLTNYTTGCLHDYQLSTADMKRLEEADILVVNGGGMESFMEDVFASYPKLPIITASEGISFLLSEEHEHAEDSDHKHEEEEYNAHVWMNMDYYLIQIQNVVENLSKLDPENAKIYEENGLNYSKAVEALKAEYQTEINLYNENKVVIFHDAFVYLAQEFNLNVVHTVNMDSETALSAGEIAEVVDEVRDENIQVLLTEEQYKTSIASNIADETGATVYVIDSGVTGNMDKEAYLNSMKNNLKVLKEAFGRMK